MATMGTRLNIGDFARSTQLSVKMLRHYHELGLLTPAAIDPESGYRQYDSAQVPTAQVIRRFRELGMPLDELRALMQARDVPARNAAIITHLRRMERQLADTQAAVASLRNLIERPPAPIAIEFRAVRQSLALVQRESIAADEVTAWLAAVFPELRSALTVMGSRRAGADAALFASGLLEADYGEVVAFIPVEGPMRGSGRVALEALPPAEYAVAVHRGSFDDADRTFAALGSFVAERAIGVDGPYRENYPIGPLETPDVSQHRTEICWPVFLTVPEKT
jgi:DNA-binding transcriptional MerR regulator/effector-binding domain-containing protein